MDEDLLLLVFVLCVEGGDKIPDALLLWKGLGVPVVDDEGEMLLNLEDVFGLVGMAKGVPHDSDEHVQEVDEQQKRSDEEKDRKQNCF